MRRFILAIVVLLAAWGMARADDTGDGIVATIQNQMEAFQARDVDRAFTFASPNIKAIFGSPQRFGAMVETGFPMVWNPAEVRYLDLREIGGQMWQKVAVRDAAGALHVLDYQMIAGPDGWQINAVQILKAPQVGA